MSYVIGLTGNLGTGKSTVAQAFAKRGARLISADQIARELCEPDQRAYKAIIKHFGKEVCHKDLSIDRKKLRSLVFADPKERHWLENLLHPLIRDSIAEEVKLNLGCYTIVEIPLLKTKKEYPYLDRILVVLSPEPLQIQRVIARDHCDEQHARDILATQPALGLRLKLADDLVFNDGSLEHLEVQVERLHHQYFNEAERKG